MCAENALVYAYAHVYVQAHVPAIMQRTPLRMHKYVHACARTCVQRVPRKGGKHDKAENINFYI